MISIQVLYVCVWVWGSEFTSVLGLGVVVSVLDMTIVRARLEASSVNMRVRTYVCDRAYSTVMITVLTTGRIRENQKHS